MRGGGKRDGVWQWWLKCRERTNQMGLVDVIFSPSEEERMKNREELIKTVPLNVSVYIPAFPSPSSSSSANGNE